MRVDEIQKVTDLVEAPLADQGFELADVVISRFKHEVTVRLFVYGSKGVTLEDCTRLSRLAGEVIDSTDFFESGYMLEVSSPGLDRPLKTARDFKYRVGEKIKVEFVDKSRKRLHGEILSADESSVCLAQGDDRVTVKLDEIRKATIVI